MDPDSVVRRAPFSDNPRVGARGQRTQQKILDAALTVFGEEGYQNCSIDRITTRAGCSRVSFYQYFSSKEDVFRQLAGQVARQLTASTDALEPVTADLAGWTALRAWVGRHAEIYERYRSVYHAFPAASERDEAVAVGSARWAERIRTRIRSSLVDPTLSPRQLEPVIGLAQESLTRTLDITAILQSVVPRAFPSRRIEDAATDVIHRALFGLLADVNVHPPVGRRPGTIEFRPVMRELFRRDDLEPDGTGARSALLRAGREVFVTRGYHATRVDDLAGAAGVSHGAFYRYFRNKDDLARILTVEAIRAVSSALSEIPDAAEPDGARARAALRAWLRRYNTAQAGEAAMIRVWVDAALADATLRADSAAAFDWGWRRLARFVAPRDFGDVDAEAVVMLGLLSGFGSRPRSPVEIEAAAQIIERGLLGRTS
jgi:AcrR family transcriptional regulator